MVGVILHLIISWCMVQSLYLVEKCNYLCSGWATKVGKEMSACEETKNLGEEGQVL
jgi:hypothetical protein